MSHLEVSFHAGQAAIYNSRARFKVCAAGRRFGKSHKAAYMLGIKGMESENRYGYRLTPEHGVYYVAPTFDQAKRIMWPKLRELLGYKNQGGLIAKENVNDGFLELINGRRIYLRGADNPDSLRGIGLSYVVLDEYADMKPEVWDMILRPALADVKGEALFIGTPKGKNHFYTLFMSAMGWPGVDVPEEYNPEAWKDWEGFFFKTMDNPFIDSDEVLSMQQGMTREAMRQELEASFISGGGNVLKPRWFEVVPHLPAAEPVRDEAGNWVVRGVQEGEIFVTVDLAGFVTSRNRVTRTDESVICTTMVTREGWYVLDMEHGHWDPRECALRIVQACKRPGTRLGIEKGALMNAVMHPLNEYMREFRRYVTPQPLTHGNTRKIDRIVWALQARAQKGRIKLIKGDWNQWFLDQVADFPDPLAHDDGADALAYVAQMAETSYVSASDIVEWEPMDLTSGY